MLTDTSKPIPTAIIEDNRFVRNGLSLILQNEQDFELIGSYASCEEAFADDELSRAKVILMDLKLPGMSGIEGVRFFKKQYPGMLIVVCTAYEDDENVFDSISSGAIGFLEKKTPPAELLKILRVVVKGGSPITPGVARKIRSLSNKHMINPTQSKIKLTGEELDILEKIAIGKSYQTVAKEFTVSELEVLIMVRKIYQKLQMQLAEDRIGEKNTHNKITKSRRKS